MVSLCNKNINYCSLSLLFLLIIVGFPFSSKFVGFSFVGLNLHLIKVLGG